MNVIDENTPAGGGHGPAPSLDAWVAELRRLLDIDDEVDVATVLDVARDVAHGIARPAAPLTAFVLGLAVGRHTPPDAPAGPALARLAPVVQERALRGSGPVPA